MQLKDKFVAFIDVLGFKSLVEAAEKVEGMPVDGLLEIVAMLGSQRDRKSFEPGGSMMCPMSRRVEPDLNFRVTQISDCAVLSTEISPAGVINLVEQSWMAVTTLLTKGHMCRGYITRGPVYHTDTQIIGSGYQNAYAKEALVNFYGRDPRERTPFVEVDPVITSYVRDETDECVQKMFGRLVKLDGDFAAIFPFKLLAHSFPLGPGFNPEKERQSNDNLRRSIRNMREKVLNFVAGAEPKDRRKAEHYVNALDAQLSYCDKTDEMIERFGRRFPN